ncbi:hypothetical protein MMC26_002069 [Xylographa opegraphella]|nr:hypothetical protein [Xylographa opegraphella]
MAGNLDVQDVLEPPTPSRSYDQHKLREGLKYADIALRNTHGKLSPIGIHALKIYKDACARMLDLELQIAELEEGEMPEEDEKIFKLWSQRLTAEVDAYIKLLRTGKDHDRCALHINMQEACVSVGFNLYDMQAYDIGKRLHDDFCDLPNIVPASQVAELQLMQQLIDAIINLWIEKKGEEDNVERWAPTEILEGLMDGFSMENVAEETVKRKTATGEVVKALRKRLRDQEPSKGLGETFDQGLAS